MAQFHISLIGGHSDAGFLIWATELKRLASPLCSQALLKDKKCRLHRQEVIQCFGSEPGIAALSARRYVARRTKGLPYRESANASAGPLPLWATARLAS